MLGINRAQVQSIKEKYKVGTRIQLHYMQDSYAVPSGTLGTVSHVDDMGTIHMQWDNGRSLGLVFDEDSFEIVTQ
jgi:hypothetical protein